MTRHGDAVITKVSEGVLHEFDVPGEPPVIHVTYSKVIDYDGDTRADLDRRFNYSLESLRGRNVLVVGAGTLGNEYVKNLVYSGVRKITVVDMDDIEYYNLPRSTMFRFEDVGQKKSLVMARRAVECAPFDIEVTGIDADITRLGWGFLERFDLVLSPVDSWSVRSYVSRGANLLHIPHVTSGTSALGFGEMSMMATAVTIEPADCRPCYECMVRGSLKDQERKLSCLSYRPETQPQVMPFSSVSAGFAVQSAMSLLLGRFTDGTGSLERSHIYHVKEMGRGDDSNGCAHCTSRSEVDADCRFHQVYHGEEIHVMDVSRSDSVRDLWSGMNSLFGREGSYDVDLHWASLYYMVYPEGAKREVDPTVPLDVLALDDRDDEDLDRLTIARMPRDHIYAVNDVSRLDPETRFVRLRFGE